MKRCLRPLLGPLVGLGALVLAMALGGCVAYPGYYGYGYGYNGYGGYPYGYNYAYAQPAFGVAVGGWGWQHRGWHDHDGWYH